MVLYTLTVSKLWDGKRLWGWGGVNGDQYDAADVTEHRWNRALFVMCNGETARGRSCSPNKVTKTRNRKCPHQQLLK